MAFQSRSHEKPPTNSGFGHVPASLQPRGFAPQVEPVAQPTMADIQARLAHAQRYGHSLAKMLAKPGATPPLIQAKPTSDASGDADAQAADPLQESRNAQGAQEVLQRLHHPQLTSPQLPRSAQRESLPTTAYPQQSPLANRMQRLETLEVYDERRRSPLLQRSLAGALPASEGLEHAIGQARGSGEPLSDTIRHPMEHAFGADFSGVRIHADTQADQLNRSIQARAFTTGQDVFFRQGAYQPGNRGGQELLAHELTHVVQQNGGAVQRHGDHSDHQHEEKEEIQLKPLTSGQSLYLQCLIDSNQMKQKLGQPEDDVTSKSLFGFGSETTTPKDVEYKAVLTALNQYHATAQHLWTTNALANQFRTDLTQALTNLTLACTTYITAHTQQTGFFAKRVNTTRTGGMTDFRDKEIPQERYLIERLANDENFATYDRTRTVDEAAQGAETASKMPARITESDITVDEDPRDGHGMAVWAKIDAGDNPIEPDPSNLGRSIYGITFEYWETVDMPYDFKEATATEVAGKKVAGEGKHHKQWNDVYAMQPDASTFTKTAAPIDVTWGDGVAAATNRTLKGEKTIGIYDCPAVWGEANRYAKRSLQFRIVFKDAYGGKHEIFARQMVELEGTEKATVRTYSDSVGNSLGSFTSAENPEWTSMGADDGRITEHGVDEDSLKIDVPPAAIAAIPAFIAKLDADEAKEFDFKEKTSIQTNDDIAGWHLLPYPQPSWKYYEYRVGSGLLVAIVNGGKLKEMYYTNNATTPLVSSEGTTFDVRSFAQIPLEAIIPQATAIPAEMIAAFTSKKALYDYVRDHNDQLNRTRTEYNLRTGDKFYEHICDYLKEILQNDPTDYKQIRDGLPNHKQLINWGLNAAFKKKFGQSALTVAELSWHKQTGAGIGVASLNPDYNNPLHAAGLLTLLQTNPGTGTEIEIKYNLIHPTHSFGQVVYDALVQKFKNDGNSKEVLTGLFRDYGDVSYLIKPAYREVFGEKQLQTVLGQLKTDELNEAVPEPEGEENQNAKRNFLDGGPFSVENYEPSTKLGRFDASYAPETGALKITLKLAFDFQNFTGSQPQAEGGLGDYANTAWTEETKQAWVEQFQTMADQVWSQKFDITCIRPGWADVPTVKTTVEVVQVDPGMEHFLVKVNKGTLVNDAGQEKLKSGSGDERSYVDTAQYKASVQQWDIQDKIKDPEIHKWLHTAEKTQHVNTSYKLDRKRIETVLKKTGTIQFEANSPDQPQTPTQLSNLTEDLERQTKFSSLSGQHLITVDGGKAPTEEGDLGDGRASHVTNYLTDSLKDIDGGYAPQKGATDKDIQGVSLSVPDNPATMEKYDELWSRLSAAHEVGHMIGLVDEYNPATSVNMVKKMISDGLLPPNTPADHLTDDGPGHEGSHGKKQEGFAQLLEDTGMNAPDFTTKVNAKSTSIMTGGFDVMGMHYVTIWEVLTKMTANHLDKKFWQLNG